MLRGFRWLALAAVVAIAALVGPTVALADGCANGAATSIYAECTPTAKGPSHPKPHTTAPPKTQTTPVTPVTPPVPPPAVTPPVVHTAPGAKHALLRVAAAAKTVEKLLSSPTHGKAHPIDPVLASSPTAESGLGSAFDLGTGPIVLFALLAGTVLFLLGTGGVRSWRNRHRV